MSGCLEVGAWFRNPWLPLEYLLLKLAKISADLEQWNLQ